MKRWMKVLCAVLALLAVLLAGLYWWQRENVKAVKDAVQYTSGELEEKLAENQQVIRDAVEAAPEIVVREVTEEERQALRDGTMTQEELVERLQDVGRQTAAEQPSGNKAAETFAEAEAPAKTEDTPVPAQKPVESSYQKELSALIARVYVLREEYTMALENMYDTAKAEYIAMPAEKRTKSNLAKLTSRYLAEATDLEKECDGKMDQIITEMETLIYDNNGDKNLPDTVFHTYVNEKSLKKSWYMSKLQEKGLI